MTTTTQTEMLTADDLLHLDAVGVRGELVRGVLCKTMPTGGEHGEIVMKLGAELLNFTRPRKLGRVRGSDAGFLLERDPDTVREPDIAFTSAERAAPGDRITSYVDGAPDLVVEVVSPSDRTAAVHDKALMWLHHGARLVWVVRPDSRTVDVYRADGTASTLAGDDAALDGLDVIPGFTCPLATIFDE